MTDAPQAGLRRIARAVRAGAIIASLSGAFFILFFMLIEAGARLLTDARVGGQQLDPLWQAYLEGAKVSLVTVPRFITDEHGFQVAHPETPGTNSAGYRTPEFDEPADGRSTILFLGDSFTWGETARPYSAAFVDQIRAAGYKTINLGVPATGPTQYEAQARLYVPELKPDVVCVAFYTDNDFEIEGPIKPGLTRCYETNLGMVNATTAAGDQISLEDVFAWRPENGPQWLGPAAAQFLAHSAAGRLAMWTANSTANASGRVERVLSQLQSIRKICGENKAKFLLFLVPTRPERVDEQNSIAMCAEKFAMLSPFTPDGIVGSDYCTAPDNHFNNSGHQKMAACILARLDEAGVPPVPGAGPGDAALYLVPRRPRMDEFVSALALAPSQREQVAQVLTTMKRRIVATYFRAPHTGGPSAGEYLASMAVDGVADPDSPAFQAYLERHGPIPLRSYQGIAEERVLASFRSVFALLDAGQSKLLKAIPMERFAAVDTGVDPLREKIASLSRPEATLRWEDLAAALELSSEQAVAVRAALDGLKEDIAAALSQPARGGGPSPIRHMAMASLEGVAGHELAARMRRYAEGNRSAETGTPYLEIVEAKAVARFEEIAAVLDEEQIEVYQGLPIANFGSVDTGIDPQFGRFQNALAELKGEAPPLDSRSWAGFESRLQLHGDQAEKIRSLLNGLKDDTLAALSQRPVSGNPAPIDFLRSALRDGTPDAIGRFANYAQQELDPSTGRSYADSLQRLEIKAREAIRATLDDSQAALINTLGGQRLADVDTGYDPMAKALQ